MKVMKLTKQEQLFSEYALAGAQVGCDWSQIFNFFKANVFLQKKQLEIVSRCRECDADEGPTMVLAGGGRGSSKSHAILAQIFCDDCVRYPGIKFLTLRKVGSAGEEQIQDFRMKLLSQLPHKYKKQDKKIEFDNGSTVIMGNFKDEKDIDKYIGLEYDGIFIMEANQLTQSKKVNIMGSLRSSKPGWRPRVYMDTNPGGIDNEAMKQLFVVPWREGRETRTRYVHSTVYDNKFVNKEYLEFLESLPEGWQREAWLHGNWDYLAGSFFTNFVDKIHVFPNEEIQFSPASVRRWFGSFDYGFSHMSAFILFAEMMNGNIYVMGEYAMAEQIPSVHSENIKAMLRRHSLVPSDLDTIVAGRDCFSQREDGHTIADKYAENDLIFIPAEEDRVSRWQRLFDMLGDVQMGKPASLFIHKSCIHTIAQIKMAQHSQKVQGDIQKFNYVGGGDEGVIMAEGDDCLDALGKGVLSNTEGGMKFCQPFNVNGFNPAMIQLPA